VERAGPEDVAAVRAIARRVIAAGPVFRALPSGRLVGALAGVSAGLLDPTSSLGALAREILPPSTGLSPAMIEWALRTSAPSREDVERLAAALAPPSRAIAAPARLAVVTLAGNVFTAGFRALFGPLLCGAPVVVKASSRDDALPRLLERGLSEVDPDVARACAVVTFPGGREDLEEALFADADVVSVYGADHTLADVRARLPGTVRFIPHGHGLGAVFVPREALADEERARAFCTGVALDVAAYDQRGCLSPHAIFVERGGAVPPRELAARIAEHGLARLARELPRGPLPPAAAAAQVQWRGVAAARGDRFEGDGFATSFEGGEPLRVSPGYRNVAVLECEAAQLPARLLPLGVHLKALGVAGPDERRRAIARALPPPLAPRVSAVGRMQTPPFDALADGEPPLAGFTRLVDLD
jgi:hypothetical protein